MEIEDCWKLPLTQFRKWKSSYSSFYKIKTKNSSHVRKEGEKWSQFLGIYLQFFSTSLSSIKRNNFGKLFWRDKDQKCMLGWDGILVVVIENTVVDADATSKAQPLTERASAFLFILSQRRVPFSKVFTHHCLLHTENLNWMPKIRSSYFHGKYFGSYFFLNCQCLSPFWRRTTSACSFTTWLYKYDRSWGETRF